ncbi:hypothetical protein Ari01nite_23490 [Paractinoplanes rishiriensis]|uniref:Uncharacterized protein n=1 Tax=Paractinoplanes rishiriensis TaxID=1050105 RepID=A0A919MU21_9ACTN|nr:hypothetical protein Ari01nite_23490 [Actinoplanes rishiriensis]
MTMTTKAPYALVPRPLSDPSRFRSSTPIAAGGRLTPFLAPPAAEDITPVLRASDRGQEAMHRLRHPFTSP